jgi:hypothetical protein
MRKNFPIMCSFYELHANYCRCKFMQQEPVTCWKQNSKAIKDDLCNNDNSRLSSYFLERIRHCGMLRGSAITM